MFRKVFTLAAIVLVFSVCQVQAEVIHSTWIGGEEGAWGEATNWEPSIVPDNGGGNTFVVIIDSNSIGVDKIEIYLYYGHTINQLDCYGKVELEEHPLYGTTLVLVDSNGLTNHGQLEIWAREDFDMVGNIYNAEGALIMGGFDIEDGNLVNAAGASFDNGTYAVDVEGSIYNHGEILSAEAGHILAYQEFHNFGKIDIYGAICESHGSFTNYDRATIRGYGMIHSGTFFENRGYVASFGSDLILHTGLDPRQPAGIGSSIINSGTLTNAPGTSLTIGPSVCDVNNVGTIEIHADGSVVFDCNLNNESIIDLRGGSLAAQTIKQSTGAIFQGFGTITRSFCSPGAIPGNESEFYNETPPPIPASVTIKENGLIKLAGPTNIPISVKIDPNATLEISDGTTLITGHTTCNNGTIHMIGGRVICQGGLSNNGCNIIWEPGIYTNMADFNLDGQVNFKDFGDFANTWLWRASWY